MKESILKIKSELFADRVVKLYGYLVSEKNECVMSKQILRSGTSIGANVSESTFGASNKDFINKLKIAQKECSETLFWLGRLLHGNFMTDKQFVSMNNDCREIGRMLTASVKTSIKNHQLNN